MQNNILRVFILILGLSTVIRNVLVLIWRLCEEKKNNIQTVQAIFMWNLAFSDLLMVSYMLFLASADIYFGNEFYKYSDDGESVVPVE